MIEILLYSWKLQNLVKSYLWNLNQWLGFWLKISLQYNSFYKASYCFKFCQFAGPPMHYRISFFLSLLFYKFVSHLLNFHINPLCYFFYFIPNYFILIYFLKKLCFQLHPSLVFYQSDLIIILLICLFKIVFKFVFFFNFTPSFFFLLSYLMLIFFLLWLALNWLTIKIFNWTRVLNFKDCEFKILT